MTTISTMIRLLLLLTMMTWVTTFVNGQDAKAQKVLDAISAKYDAYDNVTIEIDMIVTLADEEPQQSKATIIQAQGLFAIIHPDQEIYCDGRDVWMYIPDQNEAQINDYDPEEDSDFMITPKDLLSQYKSGKYEYQTTASKGNLTEIEFKPISTDSDYAKYRVSIDSKRKEVLQMWAFGKDGSVIELIITSMKPNQQLPANTFSFDAAKHPGVRIEDLRLD